MTSNDKQIYLFPTLLIKTDTALIKKKKMILQPIKDQTFIHRITKQGIRHPYK